MKILKFPGTVSDCYLLLSGFEAGEEGKEQSETLPEQQETDDGSGAQDRDKLPHCGTGPSSGLLSSASVWGCHVCECARAHEFVCGTEGISLTALWASSLPLLLDSTQLSWQVCRGRERTDEQNWPGSHPSSASTSRVLCKFSRARLPHLPRWGASWAGGSST